MPLIPARASPWLACAVLLVGGCTWTSEQELYPPVDGVPPRVVDIIPGDRWIQVPTGVEIRIWFSEPVDPATVDRASVYLFTGQELAQVRYVVGEEQDGRGLALLRPDPPLLGGVEYVLRVRQTVTDRLGNPLDHPVEIRFWTMY